MLRIRKGFLRVNFMVKDCADAEALNKRATVTEVQLW